MGGVAKALPRGGGRYSVALRRELLPASAPDAAGKCRDSASTHWRCHERKRRSLFGHESGPMSHPRSSVSTVACVISARGIVNQTSSRRRGMPRVRNRECAKVRIGGQPEARHLRAELPLSAAFGHSAGFDQAAQGGPTVPFRSRLTTDFIGCDQPA